jgi:hypothetical protein
MNRNSLFIVALIAIAAGLYFFLSGRRSPARPATATTGTARFSPSSNFAAGAGNRGTVIPGVQSGASVDLTGVATAGINAVSGLAQSVFNKIFGGRSSTVGNDPAVATPSPRVESTPYVSTWADYRQAVADAALLNVAPGNYTSQYEHVSDETFYNGPDGEELF